LKNRVFLPVGSNTRKSSIIRVAALSAGSIHKFVNITIPDPVFTFKVSEPGHY
jgi:hypothetical protein